MMRKITSSFMAMAILVASIALLQGCHTDVEHIDKQGKTVNFKASAENTKLTRTEYSGQRFTDGGVTKERINWVVGDKIRIWSDKAYARNDESLNYADYKVISVETPTNHKSSAKIANVGSSDSANDGNGLVWGTGTHRFYSLYPSPDVNAAIHYQEINTDECYLKVTMPANQSYTLQDDGVTLKPDMNYAYMFAAVETAYDTRVDLHYWPMFTAFQFTVDSGFDDEMTLYNFTLINNDTSVASSGPAGEFKVMINANSDPDRSSASFSFAGPATGQPDTLNTVNVRFNGEDGLKVTKGSPATFVVFARPQAYGRLSISFETSAGVKSLELKNGDGEWLTFGACTKTDINLSLPGTINYILTVDGSETGTTVSFNGDEISAGAAQKDIEVVSYRTLSSGINQIVPWKAQVLADDGTTWVDYGDSRWPEWLLLSQYTSDGALSDDPQTVTVFAHPDPAIISVAEVGNAGSMDALIGASEVGSDSAPRDLSLYDIRGNLHPGPVVTSITKAGSHTANCYVVNAPGYYCFPIVYGNAIDQTRGNASGVNQSAYNTYVNSANNLITSPYVLSDMHLSASDCDAVVVWMDQLTGKGVIREDLEIISAPSGAGLSCDYIKFHIAPENILPGNVLIAVRDKATSTILWSWHIWIAPVSDILTVRNIKYRMDGTSATLSTVQLLNSNIGWSAPLKFTMSQNGSATVRFVQDYGTHAPVENAVSYSGGDVYSGKYAGCTFYQFGRKDPFIPSNGNTGDAATNRTCYSPIAEYKIVNPDKPVYAVNTESLSSNAARRIRKPYVFDGSICNNTNMDYLWNSGDNETFIKKTVYDPSPAGFCVPHKFVFTGFTSDGQSHEYSSSPSQINGQRIVANTTTATPAGVSFTTDAVHTPATYTFFIPAAGERAHNGNHGDGSMGTDYTMFCGYYWLASTSSHSTYAANEFWISYLNNTTAWNVNPRGQGGMTNAGKSIRPMLEQNEVDITVTGENLKAWD